MKSRENLRMNCIIVIQILTYLLNYLIFGLIWIQKNVENVLKNWHGNDCFKVVLMKECEKKSPLRCLNCKREECDMKKITMILDKLNLLKEVNKEIK